MSDRFISTSMKRATISFTRPGKGRTTVQEDAGKCDEGLRRCIELAHKAFFKAFNALESKDSETEASESDRSTLEPKDHK
jgi:hypothetical protein